MQGAASAAALGESLSAGRQRRLAALLQCCTSGGCKRDRLQSPTMIRQQLHSLRRVIVRQQLHNRSFLTKRPWSSGEPKKLPLCRTRGTLSTATTRSRKRTPRRASSPSTIVASKIMAARLAFATWLTMFASSPRTDRSAFAVRSPPLQHGH